MYLDDILIASSNPHQHIEDLHMVCGRLKQFGLTIRLEKCIFDVSEIDFLSHGICKTGSIPLRAKVKPISDFPQTNTIRLEKCIFDVSEIDFLSHGICKTGSIPLRAKVKPISDFPQTNTV